MAVVIGSLAAHIRRPDLWSSYNDIDLVMYEREFLDDWAVEGKWSLYGESTLGTTWIGDNAGRRFEVTTVPRPEEDAQWGSTANIIEIYGAERPLRYLIGDENAPTSTTDLRDDPRTTHLLGHTVPIASLEWLYALKRSHVYKDSPHFEKTMRDLRRLGSLESTRAVQESRQLAYPSRLEHWVRMREVETYAKQHHPALNVSKANFFSDAHGVEYQYDHDSLHEAIAQGMGSGSPAYKKYKVDEQEVQCSRELFFSGSQGTRLQGVLEECYVLALERSQIPHPRGSTRRDSFLMALKGVCTRITSGWFRAFAANHYFDVLTMYEDRYVDVFQSALESGIVLPKESG